jgi:hypothetical protein
MRRIYVGMTRPDASQPFAVLGFAAVIDEKTANGGMVTEKVK